MIGRCQEAQEIANDSLRFDSFDAEAIYVRGLCLYFEVCKYLHISFPPIVKLFIVLLTNSYLFAG